MPVLISKGRSLVFLVSTFTQGFDFSTWLSSVLLYEGLYNPSLRAPSSNEPFMETREEMLKYMLRQEQLAIGKST